MHFVKLVCAGLIAGALSASSLAATLAPVQLLNPVGSTSGQVIRSTGPSTAPAWGNVTAANLAAQAANTVLANITASSASPTAVAMPSCTGAANALGYTSGTGIVCNSAINAATLGGATFAAPGAIGSTTASTGKFTTLQATSTITPSSTSGIVGTTTNDNANAGSIGEYLTASVMTNTSMSLATPTNLCSVALTAGDWDVTGNAYYVAGSTNITQMVTSINTVGATGADAPFRVQQAVTVGAGSAWTQSPMTARIPVASSATAFLVGFVNGTGNPTYQCIIRARRMR